MGPSTGYCIWCLTQLKLKSASIDKFSAFCMNTFNIVNQIIVKVVLLRMCDKNHKRCRRYSLRQTCFQYTQANQPSPQFAPVFSFIQCLQICFIHSRKNYFIHSKKWFIQLKNGLLPMAIMKWGWRDRLLQQNLILDLRHLDVVLHVDLLSPPTSGCCSLGETPFLFFLSCKIWLAFEL